MSNKKKKKGFPTAFTVTFIVLILVAVLTYLIPAGSYAKLKFDSEANVFTVTKPSGEVEELPATQETLEKLNVKVDVSKFTGGSITKPIAIPDTYEKIDSNPQGPFEILTAPIQGVYESIDIIMFVFIMGGIIGVINYTGAFDAGIGSLSKATKGKEMMLIIIVTVLIAIGGTTFGLAEETIAFYPILMPIFLVAGYDALICIAAIYMGSSLGTMFATVNPFSSVTASNAAGISFTEGLTFRGIGLVLSLVISLIYIIRYAKKVQADHKNSLIFEDKKHIEEKFLSNYNPENIPNFDFRRKLMLLIFTAAFGVMIWGVSSKDWWFTEMTALFLAVALLIGFISGIGEKKFVDNFVAGAGDLIGVALIIGVARGVNIIMENGLISDSILYFSSGVVKGMNSMLFIIVILILFSLLGFFISSSSGLATLSMPIMAPLADAVGLSRDVIVSAYQYGQGLMSFITPTGLILASLEMVDVTYDKWLKFILPLMALMGGLSIAMLFIQVIL
ncbi:MULTISPECIES: YfcC family protein [Clostridium]|uniref:YfcC family protein n=1 Tax=Clostridium faecium TaxID=2762223 RepID=A0ABR8YND8_9CLOT|nr:MULTISPECIES: YfcC family protein [Clostridium]MBD8045444.1 YfcC family protein [Clostridium faecium]MDU1348874.1 YfcC family protein [Clostridium argentinense]